jgi:HD-GYP domain-containing protein (c-di-GMP phosphodiesterase class II)
LLATNKIQVSLFDLVASLSDVTDLVNPSLDDHHKRVAYIAYSLANEMGLSKKDCCEILLAGMLHDIGALSLQEKMSTLGFEAVAPHRHAEAGGFLLRPFAPLAPVSELIVCHHVRWDSGVGREHNGRSVPLSSHILHLADRVAVLMKKTGNMYGQSTEIARRIEKKSGSMFKPEIVAAFLSLSKKSFFWLDITSRSLSSLLRRKIQVKTIELDLDGIASLAQVFSRVIDFRSPFTATHSSGVAFTAEALAQLIGYSENECSMMKIAGYFHDLGKLAVPTDILEKSAALTKREINVIRSHPFYTYRALEHIDELKTIIRWGAFHHETPAGGGYPFHLGKRDLPLGSRVMAVADVFTAITEDRPYRKGMDADRAKSVLREMTAAAQLDSRVTDLLLHNYDGLNKLRMKVQADLNSAYVDMNSHLDTFQTKGNGIKACNKPREEKIYAN